MKTSSLQKIISYFEKKNQALQTLDVHRYLQDLLNYTSCLFCHCKSTETILLHWERADNADL